MDCGMTQNGIELEQQDFRLRTRQRIESLAGVSLTPPAPEILPGVLLRMAAGNRAAAPAYEQPTAAA